MAKAVKKKKNSSSRTSRGLKAVASLPPHKKATEKAKANPKRKSARASSATKRAATSRATARKSSTRSAKTRSATKTKALSAQTRPTKRNQTPKKTATSKRPTGTSYAETLKTLVAQKNLTAKPGRDPAHTPGHRKIKIAGLKGSRTKDKMMEESMMNSNSKADRIHQTESEQRRLIPGASIERKGRRG